MTTAITGPGLRILPAEIPETTASGTGSAIGNDEVSFSDNLREAVAAIDDLSSDASQKVGDLIAGGGTDVHEAMIAVEKADLGFQLMLQVRNKVVQAYQQIAGMQF
ncbi:MAG TPA: flagellar hook-basal body complex protein FliE [Bryocella sp.]|nr:flagellar hook-basal body complex protein FliE [Bryocella sp.]